MEAKDKIIVPLDVDSPIKAIELVRQLTPFVGGFKVGLEFITAMLVSIITAPDGLLSDVKVAMIQELFRRMSGKIFWDGKFHDIPNTVGAATKALGPLGVKMFNVHASAGEEAIKAAVANKGNSEVLGVTVLTSIDPASCQSIFGCEPGDKVLQFAKMLKKAGAQGIICSPKELELLGKEKELEGMLRITPGVRPVWAAVGDQKRVMTPAEAIKAGATALVIGRPITNPPAEIGTPVDAAKRIAEEILAALE